MNEHAKKGKRFRLTNWTLNLFPVNKTRRKASLKYEPLQMQHKNFTRAIYTHLLKGLSERFPSCLPALRAMPLVIHTKLLLLLKGLKTFTHRQSSLLLIPPRPGMLASSSRRSIALTSNPVFMPSADQSTMMTSLSCKLTRPGVSVISFPVRSAAVPAAFRSTYGKLWRSTPLRA